MEWCILSVSSSRLDEAYGTPTTFSISRRYDLCGYADFQGWEMDAYSYAEFTKTKWQNSSLNNLYNFSSTLSEMYYALQYEVCILLHFVAYACACVLAFMWLRMCVYAQSHECVCLSIFLWCETTGSDCPVFPFPLWLITRVPVNPWYHHRIKRRPPSPREPISSESRTHWKAPWYICWPRDGQDFRAERCSMTSPPLLVGLHHEQDTPKFDGGNLKIGHKIEGSSSRARLLWQREILDVTYIGWKRKNKVRDRDHIVMFHSKPLFSNCSGCTPAAVVIQNN